MCTRGVACGTRGWPVRPQRAIAGCRTGRAGTAVDGRASAQRPDQALPGNRRGRRNLAIRLNRSAAPLQQLAKRVTHLTTQIIRDKHSALSANLQSILSLLSQHRRHGTRPDVFVLRAMLLYVDEISEKRHHRKETELLLPKLQARAPLAGPVLNQLDGEHALVPAPIFPSAARQ